MLSSVTSKSPQSVKRIAPEHLKRLKKRTLESRPNKAAKPWTLEEERILLQCRMDRVPYKHIAARLGKTDLACRLHYHQMVMAKRTPDAAAGRSIVFLSSEHPPEVHRLAPSQTASASSTGTPSAMTGFGMHSPSDPGRSALSLHSHQRSISVPYLGCDRHDDFSTYSSNLKKIPLKSRTLTGSFVDVERLDHICRERVSDFLSTIAAKCCESLPLSATQLESMITHAQPTNSVQLPGVSYFDLDPPAHPCSNATRRSTLPSLQSPRERIRPQPTTPEKLSVHSLLNHRRDIHT